VVRRDPRQFGIDGTRWTLEAIHTTCDWLRTTTPSGLCRLLDRLSISYKRGREHVHSPDPDYVDKLQFVDDLVRQARASAGCIIMLFEDEFTFYRQPTLAKAYEERGHCQSLAHRSYRSNTPTRVVATLDALTGQVIYHRRSKIDLDELVRFYRQVQETYAQAKRIYVVQDNWPVHFHPDVLVALEPQECKWPYHRPPSWPTEPSPRAKSHYGGLQLPIQLVPLPTYASWTNPIEKMWRWLKQAVLHMHRMADRLEQLRAQVDDFIIKFANGSLELLQYVGLLVPK